MATNSNRDGAPIIARVLLDSALPQLDHLFDYEVPQDLTDLIQIGHRVKVPFRSRQRNTTGTVIELVQESEFAGDLAVINEIVSPIPQLTQEMWELIRTVADRAGGSAADILRLVIPNRYVRVEKTYLAAQAQAEGAEEQVGEHTDEQADDILAHDAGLGATELSADPSVAELSATELGASEHSSAERSAARLVAGDRVSVRVDHPPVRLEDGVWVNAWAEVVASTAAAVFARGRSAIIVVPDYRDVDEIHDALTSMGISEHVRLDARQPASERYRNYLHALEERPQIILGNRSVVYAPAYRLGAIFMWDDGDPVLAEPLTPYVHARDAALIRTQRSGSGLLIAAHARSSEVQRLIDIGYLRAEEVIGPRRRIMHAGSHISGEPVLTRVPELASTVIREHAVNGPVLVQVALKGYAPTVVCMTCQDRARCAQCAGPLLLNSDGSASCRWCGTTARSWRCDTCGDHRLQARGAGSERTAEQLERMFPATKVIVSDATHVRSRVDGRPALVVATRGAEPIAAGGYHAIVLLDVDLVVNAETLRAGEDAMRWWHNALALAAPGAPCVITGGAGPIVRAFVTGRVDDWMQNELRDRAQLRFPPAVRVASVTGSTEVVNDAIATVSDLASVDVLGPAPYDDETVRAIVRFGYDDGAEVAARLRAALIKNASESQAKARARTSGRRRGAPPGALKLRFDDRGAFDAEPQQADASGK